VQPANGDRVWLGHHHRALVNDFEQAKASRRKKARERLYARNKRRAGAVQLGTKVPKSTSQAPLLNSE